VEWNTKTDVPQKLGMITLFVTTKDLYEVLK